MKTFEVVLKKMVNGVSFGTEREQVRKVFGAECKEVQKNIFSKNTMDVYEDYHIYYSGDNTFEAIEIFGRVNIRIGGIKVYPGGVPSLRKIIHDLRPDGDGYISLKDSVGITSEDDVVKSILFGCSGYYC